MHVSDKCGVVEFSSCCGCNVRALHEHGIVLLVIVGKDPVMKHTQNYQNKTDKTSQQLKQEASNLSVSALLKSPHRCPGINRGTDAFFIMGFLYLYRHYIVCARTLLALTDFKLN